MSFPLAAAPIAALDTTGLPEATGLIDRLRRGDSAHVVNFVEIFGRARGGARAPQVNPIGALPIAALAKSIPGAGAAETLFLSDRFWCGSPHDTRRPNQRARARLLSAGDHEVKGPLYPEEARRAATTISSANILDGDGLIAGFLETQAIDGGRAVFSYGEEGGDAAEHIVYFEALVKSTARDGPVVTVSFDTAPSLLDAPAQTVKYSGAGGEGGDPRLKDRYVPLVYGPFFNVEPLLEETDILSYRTNVGDIDGYDVIKDRGVPLAWDGRTFADYPSYRNAMVAAPPAPGTYSLGPNSRFALGDAPAGIVTCDGRGSKLFGTYAATTSAILRFILAPQPALNVVFDESTFGFLPNDAIYLYLDGATAWTKAEIANALLAPYLAWLDIDAAGRIAVARAGDPDAGNPADTLTENDILDGWRLAALDNPIRFAQEVTWGRNWRPMGPAEIADPAEQPLISVDEWSRLQREEEIAAGGDASVLIPHPSAKAGPRLRGYFASEQPARTAADEIFALFGKELALAEIPVKLWRAYSLRRGARLAVVHPEMTGGKTKNMIITGMKPSPASGRMILSGAMSV